MTTTLLSPFSGIWKVPDQSSLAARALLGSDVGLGVFAIGHSPAPLHEFVVQAHGADKALSDGASVLVYISLLTPHRLAGDQIIQLGGGLLAAPVIFTAPLAKLTALRGVDAVEPYSGTPDLQCIAINHGYGPSDVGEGDRRQQQAKNQQEKAGQWRRPIT